MYHITSFVAVLLLCLSRLDSHVSAIKARNYTGYTVYRSVPQTRDQLDALTTLMVDNEQELDVSFWSEPYALNRSVDIMVSPRGEAYLMSILENSNISSMKMIEDLGELSNHFYGLTRMSSCFGPEFYLNFQRFSEMECRLKSWEELYPDMVQLEVIGQSTEARPIYMLKISANGNQAQTQTQSQKPVIFIEGGTHAREWIGSAASFYLIDSILTGSLKSELKNYDFWVVPMVNPDGYEYSHTSDRYWRKNRSKTGSIRCAGVDLNRNYDVYWGTTSRGTSPCKIDYPGPRALSEPETSAVAKVLSENAKSIVFYVALHCYGQMILTPYGHAPVFPQNYPDMMRVARAGARAIAEDRGTQYTSGSSASTLYAAAGGSDDYAYKVGIPLSYTIELPDTGFYGFATPSSEILPISRETAKGLMAMIQSIERQK